MQPTTRAGDWRTGTTLLVLALVAPTGCHRGHPISTDPSCGPGETVIYTAPGCGALARAVCGRALGDGCSDVLCGCDGQSFYGCEQANRPFASYGACPASTVDAAVDASIDAGSDGDCPAGQVLFYATPGCGVQARGECRTPATFDAGCVTDMCTCTGKTIQACGAVTEPFGHYGACTDAEFNPDADRCCAVGTPGCGCFQIGGTRQSGLCPAICDAGGRGWTLGTDSGGCPVLTHTGAYDICLPPPPRDAAIDQSTLDAATETSADQGA